MIKAIVSHSNTKVIRLVILLSLALLAIFSVSCIRTESKKQTLYTDLCHIEYEQLITMQTEDILSWLETNGSDYRESLHNPTEIDGIKMYYWPTTSNKPYLEHELSIYNGNLLVVVHREEYNLTFGDIIKVFGTPDAVLRSVSVQGPPYLYNISLLYNEPYMLKISNGSQLATYEEMWHDGKMAMKMTRDMAVSDVACYSPSQQAKLLDATPKTLYPFLTSDPALPWPGFNKWLYFE